LNDIELAASEVFGLKFCHGLPDRHDFGMRRRVVRLCHPINPLREDHAVLDDHARKRPSPLLDIGHGQFNRSPDEIHAGVSVGSGRRNYVIVGDDRSCGVPFYCGEYSR
jgi:hypothetical protein